MWYGQNETSDSSFETQWIIDGCGYVRNYVKAPDVPFVHSASINSLLGADRMAEYGVILKKLWTNPRFKALSDRQKLFLTYLFTGPHHNIVGVYVLEPGYAHSDTGWPMTTVAATVKQLSQDGWITVDPTVHVVVVHGWFEIKAHNIQNDNQLKKALSQITEVPRSIVFEKAISNLSKPDIMLADRYIQPLTKAFRDRLPNRSETVPKPLCSESVLSETESVSEAEIKDPPRKRDDIPPYQEIIDDLNQELQSVGLPGKYRRGRETEGKIKARWDEGFSFADFRYVHAVKIADWRGTDYEKWLRPSTLYRASKFSGYRNQRIPGSEITDQLTESGQKLMRDAAELERELFGKEPEVKKITGG